MEVDFNAIAEQVGNLLQKKNLRLVTAESCTGGWVAQVITNIAGSSNWFERGFVTYSNQAKAEMLGVSRDIIEKHGAVSEEAAQTMAKGALEHSAADVSLAVTGIAGPDGGLPDKPVGTIWFAWANTTGALATQCRHFAGDRFSVRQQSVQHVLQGLVNFISAGNRI